MLNVVACAARSHDLRLVAIAAFMCLLASITAVGLWERAVAASGLARLCWLTAAGVAFGCGVWTTHFIAMLAYLPAAGLSYAGERTIASLALALAGGVAGFGLSIGRRPAMAVGFGGITLGAAIGAAHFTGIAALRPSPLLAFAPPYMGAALALGTVCAAASLWALRQDRRAVAAACAALAVCGLHFLAMGGTTIAVAAPPSTEYGNAPLALAVGALAAFVLSLALLGVLIDRHLAHRAIAEAARLRRFADATFEGIVFIRDGKVTDANAALCAMLGRAREALVGQPPAWLLTRPESADVLTQDAAAEAEILDGAGRRRPVELLSRRFGAVPHHETVLAVRDLSDRKQAEARIQHLAHHDSLTGLPNRVLFHDRLTQAVSLAERMERQVALLCLDLDGFKAVNDLLGHSLGDQVLVEAGARLAGCLRESDTVARLGGDEFAIVQALCEQPRGAATLAERIGRLLAEPFELEGQRIRIGASIGIALFPSDARTPDALLRNADLALYGAKRAGRGVWRFFEPQMDERLQQRRTLEQDLRGAILRNELHLHYQPLLNGTTLEIDGFEALLRWNHPQRGPVSPAEFVAVAEECGLIVQLGNWVLETACREATSWKRPWRVAVNLSPAQFKQRDLPDQVRGVLFRSGLSPSRLELEITEGILIDDAERALAALRELKALGVRVALDDFGTGYSSLSYLRRFPVDKLKIGASFVQSIGDGGEADAIVRAIVALGRSLSLNVTAEGVETKDQLHVLRAHACDQVQGYLLGRPMPPEKLADLPGAPAAAALA